MERIIVRRGRYLTYELLRRTFGRDPNVEIIWDRRKGERAPSGEERRQERRSDPPVEWDRLDYLFTNRMAAARFQQSVQKEPPV